jgi:signal transduction histidine kinase
VTLRRKIGWSHSIVVGVCLLLLAGLAHHEFIVEPRERLALGLPEPPETFWGEYAEVFFYGVIPVALLCGGWLMRRQLAPLGQLAAAVQHIDVNNLRQPLARSFNGDEVDRLTEAFNTVATRLDRSIRHIREFTLHTSHELKTPLTVMQLQVETLLDDGKSLAPDLKEWLECQLDEMRRLGKIVDALTLLAKAEAGQLKLEVKPVPLGELVRESYEDAQILAESRRIRVTLGQCEEATVAGDRHRLRQLLLNLTDNAIKYNRPDGQVTIEMRARGDVAEIKILNTGEGVPPEMRARVFERFVRGDEARSKAIEGSGLGLSICQWIVEAHQGTIKLASEPGKTTKVIVRLPLAA